MKKHKDLQPWLDYFQMLRTYEEKGFLQTEAEKHEAYVTRAALLTLAGVEPADGMYDSPQTLRAIGDAVRRIRTYAAFLSLHGKGYMTYPFAVHVVRDVENPELLHTVVVTVKRRWQNLWMLHDSFDVINYE